MRFGLSDLDELPSLKEFEALAREALGSDEALAADISEEQVSELHPETDVANASAPVIHETMQHVGRELASAETEREHEALATSEGMPSGQLDEDPPPPNAKSTAASD
jgi:hypothetical protein